ncbi:NAD-dependent epimerase/dehydratase family protein [Acinetobacter sp. WCHAc060033]|uniref:NAD(P)H-binding protein n=1 Tax=Acinetobacter sp. WCHAc060033 TaxID=2518624 RepID=UPI0010231C8E|nr:NAD(P)H-binding protein [Acinetobacter sp. WCHAc060033]RZG79251.1 NAD-dependent epimerase/dehydratase family protein [Acinetobacter sp. WCHAc060033]
MHILFVGYGKTSQRVAKQLFQQDHQITTVSRSPKEDDFAEHLIQDIQQLDLSQLKPVDTVYVLLAPSRNTTLSSVEAYQQTYVDSVQPIVSALKNHPIQRIIVVSSTRVYGENNGEIINDDSPAIPSDEQGKLLLKMEQLWQQAYPEQCVIVRPTGIYGTSTVRMVKLAETTKSYPNIHWSNRIHIDDLASFLAHLLHVEHPEKSYICTNNNPQPLHEMILKIQRELGLLELVLESERETGKRIFSKEGGGG